MRVRVQYEAIKNIIINVIINLEAKSHTINFLRNFSRTGDLNRKITIARYSEQNSDIYSNIYILV